MSTLTRRSMFSACRTFSAFELRADYGFIPSAGDVRAMFVHERPWAHNALSLRVFLIPFLLTLSAAHLLSAWPVCGWCLLGTFSVVLKAHITQAHLTKQLRCAHWQTSISSRTKRTFTARELKVLFHLNSCFELLKWGLVSFRIKTILS